MALIYFDGFDHYAGNATDARNPHMVGAWDWHGQTGNDGYFSTRNMPELGGLGAATRNFSSFISAGQYRLYRNFPGRNTGFVGVGFYAYFASDASTSFLHTNGNRLVGFSEGSTVRFSVGVTTDGQVRLHSGRAVSILGTSESNLSQDTLYHFEVQYHFGDGDGWVELRIDGVTVITVTDLVLTNSINRAGIFMSDGGVLGFGNHVYIDNLYLYDNTGAQNNDWLGERRVYTLRPNADGTPQDWTLSGGTDGFELLNNRPSDPNNDYLVSSNVGDEAAFGFTDLISTDIVISGVMAAVQHYKTGTDPASVSVKLSEESAAIPAPTSTASWDASIEEQNAATSQPWAPSEVDALEVVFKRVV